MFEYLLMPLDAHFDYGFGMTAEAYKDAADKLAEERRGMHGHLPIRFLLRHAIELYLKSGILIFHRKLHLPYGIGGESEPMVRTDKGWKSLKTIHSIKLLHAYWDDLFKEHADYLAANTRTDWSMPDNLPNLVNLIDGNDPGSTFYRYPTTSDPQKDKKKSSSQRVPLEKLLEKMASGKGTVKSMLLIDQNEEIVDSFQLNTDDDAKVGDALVRVADFLSCAHAAMRNELAGGR
ncbi:MAG: hypothetical protein ACM31D_00245 [Bacteroidota bacterium]